MVGPVNRHYFWQRHPWMTLGIVVVYAAVMTNGWYLVGASLTVAIVCCVAHSHRRRRAIERAGLRARADLEHRLVLSGDPRGTYGRFPPVQPGWFPDPGHIRRIRYFDGAGWTRHTASR